MKMQSKDNQNKYNAELGLNNEIKNYKLVTFFLYYFFFFFFLVFVFFFPIKFPDNLQ